MRRDRRAGAGPRSADAPDVAILDVRLPDGNGVEVCREIRSDHPEIQCIMLTSFADDEALFEAIVAGRGRILLKQIRGTDIVDAVRRVADGQSLLDPAVTARVLEWMRRAKTGGRAAAAAHRAGAQDPGAHRRGPDQPSDRRADVPRREDGQELRVEPARRSSACSGGPRPRCLRPDLTTAAHQPRDLTRAMDRLRRGLGFGTRAWCHPRVASRTSNEPPSSSAASRHVAQPIATLGGRIRGKPDTVVGDPHDKVVTRVDCRSRPGWRPRDGRRSPALRAGWR